MNRMPQDPPLSPDTNDLSSLALSEGGDPPHLDHHQTRAYIHAVVPAAGFGQRFDPGAELLRRQFRLQLRSTGLPKFFHAIGLV